MSGTALDLAPPDDAAVADAVAAFARAVRAHYGERLRGLYLFGSRARGDHTPDSDADIAVVLADGRWDRWREKMRLADLEYDCIVATGVEPQAWPIAEAEWSNPAKHRNPDLVRAMRRDGREIPAG
jgi:predicted nucleotidyltransferase